MRALIGVALLAALATTTSSAFGQSLAEAAAKERERRKAAAGKTRPYTESDLGQAKGGTYNGPGASTPGAGPPVAGTAPAAGTVGSGTPAAPAAGEKEKSPDEARAQQEKAWRDRVQSLTADIGKTQQRIDTLQRALNDLSGNLYGASRTQQVTQLEEAQKQLVASRQQLADLEEEGRRNGWR